jgi:stage II sporulation protein D
MVGAPEVVIGGDGDALAAADGQPEFALVGGRTATLRADGTAFTAEGAGAGRYERLAFASAAAGRPLTVAGRAYRGSVDVFVRRGALTVVNVIPVETYLQGVVNAELGRRGANERAALEAQAIVSRTYALRNRGRFVAEGYDLQAGVADQAYGGVASETEDGIAAVRATRGQVRTYGGELIAPFYHSTCGGRTASPEEAFVAVRALPYLRPVRDTRPDGAPWCDASPRLRWTVEWEGQSLRGILGRTLPAALGVDASAVADVRDVYVRRRGPSGRAVDVRVRVANGEIPVPAHALRTVFETPDGRPLGGSAVEFEVTRDGEQLTRLVARGTGWGHGVGLCQWGAVGRARGGQNAQAILDAYYPGTTHARWY